MCFDGGALARAQYARANFRISPELFIFFGARSFIADKGVVLVYNSSERLLKAQNSHIKCVLNFQQVSNDIIACHCFYKPAANSGEGRICLSSIARVKKAILCSVHVY